LATGAASQEIDSPARGANSLILRQTDEFLLLREMHHRVANTLTVLTSVLQCNLPYLRHHNFKNRSHGAKRE
jgi:two-component sensor histidine kinase